LAAHNISFLLETSPRVYVETNSSSVAPNLPVIDLMREEADRSAYINQPFPFILTLLYCPPLYIIEFKTEQQSRHVGLDLKPLQHSPMLCFLFLKIQNEVDK
jgi:hypothetical protein